MEAEGYYGRGQWRAHRANTFMTCFRYVRKRTEKGALSELNNFIEPSGSHKESTVNVMVR